MSYSTKELERQFRHCLNDEARWRLIFRHKSRALVTLDNDLTEVAFDAESMADETARFIPFDESIGYGRREESLGGAGDQI